MNIFSLSILLAFGLGLSGASPAAGEMEAGAEATASKAQYLKMEPDFIVNLKDGGRRHFMKLNAQVLASSDYAIESLQHHMPAIRRQLLLLYSEQEVETMRSVDGKNRLFQQSLQEINQVLETETVEERADAVFFTSFVIQ